MRSNKSIAPEKATKAKLPNWAELLTNAVHQPGIISSAYSRFWNYSVGNQLLAMFQCLERGIELGPIHTFKGWTDLNRQVKKGERALTLCMPVQVKPKRSQDLARQPAPNGEVAETQLTSSGGVVPGENGTELKTVFTYKPRWFVLSQTEGEPYTPQESPEWSESNALHSLLVHRIVFTHLNGNCQGYADGRTVAVSPIAVLPHKTLFHELAHVVLGHTADAATLDDHDRTPRNLREVEAESVALICVESLGLPGASECRGYIQNWLGSESIPDRNAQRIFKSADQILKAGRPEQRTI